MTTTTTTTTTTTGEEPDAPHRVLDFAPSGRGHCSGGCGRVLAEGQLRYGTTMEIQGHQSVSHRCVDCVTPRQAKNIRAAAAREGLSVLQFLTAAPSVPPRVVALFVRYLDALAASDNDSNENDHHLVRALRMQLDRCRHHSSDALLPPIDTHLLDAQIRKDIDLLNVLSHDDLLALANHHGIALPPSPPSTTTADLECKLRDYYNPAALFHHGPNHHHDGHCHHNAPAATAATAPAAPAAATKRKGDEKKEEGEAAAERKKKRTEKEEEVAPAAKEKEKSPTRVTRSSSGKSANK